MRVGPAVLLIFVGLVCCVYKQNSAPGTEPTHIHLGVPSNEWPAAGQCRIWIPGMPAESQRPAGACPMLVGDVPSGAWLVHRDEGDDRYVKVAVYHPERPGLLMAIHVYDARTGSYVRNEAP